MLNEVNQAIKDDPKTPIGADLFSLVGEPLGLGKTLTEELYYEAKKLMSF